MTAPRNNNMDESVISETYDLLNGSSEHIHKDGTKYQLQKPSQNSELKEIRFRSFDPIMKKNLSTLSQRSAEISIEPRLMKATKGDAVISVKCTRNQYQPKLTCGIFNEETHNYAILKNFLWEDNDIREAVPIYFKNHVFIVTMPYIEGDDIPPYYQGTKFLLCFGQTAYNNATAYFAGHANFFIDCYKGYNIYDFTGKSPSEEYGCMYFTFNASECSFQRDEWLEIHYSPNNEDHHPHDGKVWNPTGPERLRLAFNIQHITSENQVTLNPKIGDELCYDISAHYTTKLLTNYDASKIDIMTYANDTYLPVKSEVLKTNLIGDPKEIITNINEKIAGYCSNFKPSSTMRLIDHNDATPKTWHLTNYEEGPNEDWSIERYYDTFSAQNRLRSVVVPTRNFTKFYVQGNDTDGYIFGTSHLMFNFRIFGTQTDPDVPPDIFYLMFIVNIRCDVDIFNVGTDRQYHNNLENIIEHNYLDATALLNKENQCISTNADTELNLTYANYLAHGLDLVLKSPHMANLTNTVFVNKCIAEVYMKVAQQFSTQNSITVYLTDINNKPIDEEYLKKIYKSIIVEIDYLYA